MVAPSVLHCAAVSSFAHTGWWNSPVRPHWPSRPTGQRMGQNRPVHVSESAGGEVQRSVRRRRVWPTAHRIRMAHSRVRLQPVVRRRVHRRIHATSVVAWCSYKRRWQKRPERRTGERGGEHNTDTINKASQQTIHPSTLVRALDSIPLDSARPMSSPTVDAPKFAHPLSACCVAAVADGAESNCAHESALAAAADDDDDGASKLKSSRLEEDCVGAGAAGLDAATVAPAEDDVDDGASLDFFDFFSFFFLTGSSSSESSAAGRTTS